MYLTAAGQFLPKDIITNDELVASFNTYVDAYNAQYDAQIQAGQRSALAYSSAEFIKKASGISARHVLDKDGILNTDIMAVRLKKRNLESGASVMGEMGAAALQQALKARCISGEDLDAVICASSGFERQMPAIAIEIAHLVGCKGFGFDMNVACASACFGIASATGLIATGQARRVAVVCVELPTTHLNFRNRDSHFIFGDGAAAVIIENDEALHEKGDNSGAFSIIDTALASDFSSNIQSNTGILNRAHALAGADDDTHAPDSHTLFHQQGRRVFRDVCPMVSAHISEQLLRLNIPKDTVAKLWLHQANQSMIDLILRTILGKDADKSRAPLVLNKLGNTSSASVIMAFLSDNDLQKGQIGVFSSFGAGYALGSLVLKKV